MQPGNISQFLRWGYSSTGVNHEVAGENSGNIWGPSEDDVNFVKEGDIQTEPVPQ
jgi:hypothetical protein